MNEWCIYIAQEKKYALSSAFLTADQWQASGESLAQQQKQHEKGEDSW